MKRKKVRTANDPELDKAVFAWFVKERQVSSPISGPVLSVQAQKFQNYLHEDNPSDSAASKTAQKQWYTYRNGATWSETLTFILSLMYSALHCPVTMPVAGGGPPSPSYTKAWGYDIWGHVLLHILLNFSVSCNVNIKEILVSPTDIQWFVQQTILRPEKLTHFCSLLTSLILRPLRSLQASLFVVFSICAPRALSMEPKPEMNNNTHLK